MTTKEWKIANKEKIKIYWKKWSIKNKEARKEYFKKRYAGRRMDKKVDREKARENNRRYYSSEKGQETTRRWLKNNKAKRRFNERQREYRERNADGSHTLQEWERLKKEFSYTCPMCGKKEPEIQLTEDHIIPLSKKGTNFINNIQPLCMRCNSKKYTQIIIFSPIKTNTQSECTLPA